MHIKYTSSHGYAAYYFISIWIFSPWPCWPSWPLSSPPSPSSSCNSGDPCLPSSYGVRGSSLSGRCGHPGHLRCCFFRCLPAVAVVPCGTWRRPAAEGEGSHPSCRHLCPSRLHLLAAAVVPDAKSVPNCNFYLQRAVTPDCKGSIALWYHVRAFFSRLEKPSDDINPFIFDE